MYIIDVKKKSTYTNMLVEYVTTLAQVRCSNLKPRGGALLQHGHFGARPQVLGALSNCLSGLCSKPVLRILLVTEYFYSVVLLLLLK